jgi:hypothetical protein
MRTKLLRAIAAEDHNGPSQPSTIPRSRRCPRRGDARPPARRRLRAQLVSALVEGGVLSSAEWRRAFERVRRDVFVPRFWRHTGHGWELVDGARPDQSEDWLEAVYQDQVLFLRMTG